MMLLFFTDISSVYLHLVKLQFVSLLVYHCLYVDGVLVCADVMNDSGIRPLTHAPEIQRPITAPVFHADVRLLTSLTAQRR